MSRKRSRPPRVEFTPEQADILAGIDREVERPSNVWLEDQIAWRNALVNMYKEEISKLEKRLSALKNGEGKDENSS